MSGSFDVTGSTGPLSTIVSAPGVFRFNGSSLTLLPNIICLSVHEKDGPDPHTAHFVYIQDDVYQAVLGWPARVDNIWPSSIPSGPYVVQNDDRIVVIGLQPDGSQFYIFDGFAQIPQIDVQGGQQGYERASFTAISVAAREFDNPISGRVQRDSDPTGIQDTSGESDFGIDLPARFNPADNSYGDDGGYQPNKTPDNFDTDPADDSAPAHPVFVQAGIQGRPANQSPAYWSISDAIKHILAEYNPDSTWTSYLALSQLDTILETVYAADDGPINPGDITSDPLLIRDFDASNKPWPEAVAQLLAYAGFTMRWSLETGANGGPITVLRVYRKDVMATTPVKWLYWDDVGNSLWEGSPNNVASMNLVRDSNSIVNAWQVETNQQQVEISIYLAPLFMIAASDATADPGNTSGRTQFIKANLIANNATGPTLRKYRWHGADEIGDGYWSATAGWVTDQPCDFTSVFPDDEDGSSSYTIRYRPGVDQLISVDTLGSPLHARLDIAFGVGIAGPQVASQMPLPGNPQWFPVPGGWRLLKDRLGIEVTADDPEHWSSDNKDMPGGGDIRGVTWWANPPEKIGNIQTNNFPPLLRLTVVIEDDLRMPISVNKRAASPTQYTRFRVADARDHFQYESIDQSSVNYNKQVAIVVGNGGSPSFNDNDALVLRDDTDAANSHAFALQRAYEMPPLAGSVRIPGIVGFYNVGDRISYISGRGMQLYQSANGAGGESPTYPSIVSRSFSFEEGNWYTTLNLSDNRATWIPSSHRRTARMVRGVGGI